MTTKKIQTSEINASSVASLPDHPCADKAYGGSGFTPQQMKAAFDRLAILAIERLNSLIDDIEGEGEGRVAESIKTGIRSGHTLEDFFFDLTNGTLASYLTVGDTTLAEKLSAIEVDIKNLKSGIV